jgi:hypothetical protein
VKVRAANLPEKKAAFLSLEPAAECAHVKPVRESPVLNSFWNGRLISMCPVYRKIAIGSSDSLKKF